MIKYEKIEHDYKLPTKLLDFYYEDYQGQHIDKHWHRSVEILIPLYGDFLLWVNGNEIKMNAGDIFIVNSKEIHMITPSKQEGYYKGYALQIDYEYLKRCYPKVDKIYFTQPDNENTKKILTCAMDIIRYYQNHSEYNYIRIYSYINLLVFLLLDNLGVKKDNYIEFKSNNHKNKIVAILKYIDNNYNEDLSATSIAQYFNISEGYLYRLFKENLNVSLKNYINNVRFNHAKNDLIITNYPIIDIAISNGFPNIKSFNNYFHKIMGISPKEYRKKMRK